MNEHETKFIASFILKEKQTRYRYLLVNNNSDRRNESLNRLNHCTDLNEKYLAWLPTKPRSTTRNVEIAELLLEKGSPDLVYVIACACTADGRTMPLFDALIETTEAGWGTIISCIPGELAYYFDEEGERRAILERNRD